MPGLKCPPRTPSADLGETLMNCQNVPEAEVSISSRTSAVRPCRLLNSRWSKVSLVFAFEIYGNIAATEKIKMLNGFQESSGMGLPGIVDLFRVFEVR